MNSSCGSALYVDSQVYRDFDVAASLGIEFPAQSFDFGELAEPAAETEPVEANYVGDEYRSFDMRVVDRMSIYANIGDTNPIETLYAGEVVSLTETEDPIGSESATRVASKSALQTRAFSKPSTRPARSTQSCRSNTARRERMKTPTSTRIRILSI